jgi:hypothetical protein
VAMAKAQAELRDAFKGKNKITESDIQGLRYLTLLAKEALRLHSRGPCASLLEEQTNCMCRIDSYLNRQSDGVNDCGSQI